MFIILQWPLHFTLVALNDLPCLCLSSSNCRSSHRRCSVKEFILKNFAKFTDKHLCYRLFFNKVAGLRPATLLRKSFWHRSFPVNFEKFLRTLLFENTFQTTASVTDFPDFWKWPIECSCVSSTKIIISFFDICTLLMLTFY